MQYADGTIATLIYGYAGSSFDTTGASGELQASVDALGNRTSYVYNGRGQVMAQQDALGNLTTTVTMRWGTDRGDRTRWAT